MTSDKINSHYKAPILQLGIDVEGYVLDEINGELSAQPLCVLSKRGAKDSLGIISGGGDGFTRFLSSKALAPKIPDLLLEKINNPILFKYLGNKSTSQNSGKVVHGYTTETFISIVSVLIGEYTQNKNLSDSQKRILEKCQSILLSLANTTLDTLIYQETGYWQATEGQKVSEILNKYLLDYAKKWSKVFPDRFWQLLIKTKGYPNYMAIKRPSFVGHWVNDIIYDRLAPNIKSALQKRNPRSPQTKTRFYLHHQFLTEDNGVPELHEHIVKVMSWMEVARNEKDFKRMLDKGAPKFNTSGFLDFIDD